MSRRPRPDPRGRWRPVTDLFGEAPAPGWPGWHGVGDDRQGHRVDEREDAHLDAPQVAEVPAAIRAAEVEHRAALGALMAARHAKASPQLVEAAARRLAHASRALTRALVEGGEG